MATTAKRRREDEATTGEGDDEAHGVTLPVWTGWRRLTSDSLAIVEDAFEFLDAEVAKEQASRTREQRALHLQPADQQAAAPMVETCHAQVLGGAPAFGQTGALAPAMIVPALIQWPPAQPSAIAHPAQPTAWRGRTLNEAAAAFIFQQKLLRPHDPSLSARLAHQFSVTAKTVRDIWTLRTWTHATMPYWTAHHRQQYLG